MTTTTITTPTRRPPTDRQRRRMEEDWFRHMANQYSNNRPRLAYAIVRMYSQYSWNRSPAYMKGVMSGPDRASKIRAYIAARQYALGGRMPVTLPKNFKLGA